jgi:hypothetical protein
MFVILLALCIAYAEYLGTVYPGNTISAPEEGGAKALQELLTNRRWDAVLRLP